MNIAISVVIIISIFNFVFIYSVAKVVLKHDQIISFLIKNASLYVWYKGTNQLQVISIEDENNVTTYADYDFKLFIKVMKQILRRKSFN